MSYYAYILKMLFHFMDLYDSTATLRARKNSLDQ